MRLAEFFRAVEPLFAGRSGAVIKDVAEMRIACFAANLSALHSVGRIPLFHHGLRRYGLGETGPARAAVELVQRTEERFARDNIDVNSGLVIVPVSVVKRSFRAAFSRDVILIFRQLSSQFGVAGNWFGWIHFLRFFLLGLSVTKQDRADNDNDCAKQSKP